MHQVNPGGAHHTYKPDMRRVLESRDAAQVSSTIAAPVANNAYDLRFKTTVCTHIYSIPAKQQQLILYLFNDGINLAEQFFIRIMLEGYG